MELELPHLVAISLALLALLVSPILMVAVALSFTILFIVLHEVSIIEDDPIVVLTTLLQEEVAVEKPVETPAARAAGVSPSVVFLLPAASFLTAMVAGISIHEQTVVAAASGVPVQGSVLLPVCIVLAAVMDGLVALRIFREVAERRRG